VELSTTRKEEENCPDQDQPSLYIRPQPSSIEDLGVPRGFLAELALKQAYYLDVFILKDLADRMKVNLAIITEVSEQLTRDKLLETRAAEARPAKSSFTVLGNRYALTEEGKRRAVQALEYDSYAGPVPVPLEDYWEQVRVQSIQHTEFEMHHLEKAFEGLVVSHSVLEQLGPALMGGKSLFLYGPTGNGKTSIALRVGKIWDDAVFIPYALYVEGHVIPVFDVITHQSVEGWSGQNGSGMGDRRWILCHRPIVVVGGELGLGMLDLVYDSKLKFYGAPLQLKANNGIFVLDDFGRQQVPTQLLLNRWIVPMENRQDFLYLCTGQKFAIPYDQLLIFATNMDPAGLVDPAFFRRIRAKVKIEGPERVQYKEIFRRICQNFQLEYNDAAVEYLLVKYYDDDNRALSACHPRDLVEQMLDFCRFNKQPRVLEQDSLDRVCQMYFAE
jgi:predicted ATPase with chaperone activity